MKRLFPALMIAVVVLGCGPDPGPAFKYTFVLKNESGLSLVLTCTSCETVSLAIGETKSIQTNADFIDYEIASTTTTTRTIDFEEDPDHTYTITSYEWEVEYRISGTASMVDVTLQNGSNGISLYSSVTLPVSYQFRTFASQTAFCSAVGFDGTLKVEIYHKDKQVQVGESAGDLAMATASVIFD